MKRLRWMAIWTLFGTIVAIGVDLDTQGQGLIVLLGSGLGALVGMLSVARLAHITTSNQAMSFAMIGMVCGTVLGLCGVVLGLLVFGAFLGSTMTWSMFLMAGTMGGMVGGAVGPFIKVWLQQHFRCPPVDQHRC